MRDTVEQKMRRSLGFTLMELLVTIAILGVVVAIAAPSLAHIARGQEMSRLDNYAKEIYVALQDQLIGMEASGECARFNEALSSAYSTRNLGYLDARPADAADSRWSGYYYLEYPGNATDPASSAADAFLADIVARTPVVKGLIAGGRCVVEVSPRSDGTDVYAVFYSDDPEFSYDDLVGLASRERDARMDTGRGYAIGYYCGMSAEGDAAPDHFSPRATFVNGEELFLNIVCPAGMSFVGSESSLEVKLRLECGDASETMTLVGGRDFFLNSAGNIDFDILFDSMREGFHLADLFPDFAADQAGKDISALVEVTYIDGSTTISTPEASRGQAVANSLYAKNADGLIEVANVRHLSNLGLLPADAHTVNQVADIDFDAAQWGRTESTQLSQATKLYNQAEYGTDYVNPLDPGTVPGAAGFAPIDCASGAIWSFDGRGNTVSNFVIGAEGPTGLFNVIRESQLVRNVVLVDPVVSGTGPTGALAGRLLGQISNCGVRLDVANAADADKEDSRVLRSSGDAVGGLVGQVLGAGSIDESYAAIRVVASSGASVGGLVGQFDSSGYLSRCYAAGDVDALGGAVGGLVGSFAGGSISDCYASGDVYAAGPAGGLVGSADAGSLADSRSFGRVTADVGGGFVGAQGAATFANCSCLSQLGYNDALAAQPEGVDLLGHAELATGGLSAEASHPYRASLQGQAFPYAPLLKDHWGNWPQLSGTDLMLVYYEHYADDTYGYYSEGRMEDAAVEIYSLDESLPILDDGYAILSPYPLRGFSASFNDAAPLQLSVAAAPADEAFVELPISDLAYRSGDVLVPIDNAYVYQLPFSLQMPDRSASALYDRLTVTVGDFGASTTTDYLFYYNPDFAMSAVNPDAEGNTPIPTEERLFVRTARHLNRLGYQSAYWGASIMLARELDFSLYTTNYLGHNIDFMNTSGPYANRPIGNINQPFTGTFDGEHYAVFSYNLSSDGSAVAGLFGRVDGTVRNVHLMAPKTRGASVVHTGGVPSGVSGGVGALAGMVVGGTVSGCSVTGYEVRFGGSATVDEAVAGALVGLNVGTVTESAAANSFVTLDLASASGASLGAGGLVGGNAGNIARCYAVDNYTSILTSTSGSGRTLSYGGIAASAYSGDNPRVSDCYAYVYPADTRCADADTVLAYAVAMKDGQSISNCYRLDIGEDTNDAASVALCSPAELQEANLSGFGGLDTPRATYGDPMLGQLAEAWDSYPYPVICKDLYGNYAHYGAGWRQ